MKTKTEKAYDHLLRSVERIKANLERDLKSAVAKFKRGVKDCPAKSGFAFTPPTASVTDPKLYKVE